MAAADALLAKLRRLIDEELEPEERALFAALLAPGIALAYEEDEVEGFGLEWTARRLPDALAELIRDRNIRVVGL